MIEIPGYRVLRQLGRGGMATVYLAIQESVEREVALKVMSPALLADPHFGERFLREAKIAAKLHHRHVVGVHDVGRHGNYHYIAMEYLPGGPVLPKDGKACDVKFALRVVREIATALHYAHSKGFVHRDVKPDNILLRDDNASALTDFGIARANDSATRMTRTGAVIGTPHYMSPEQARGKSIDGRADIYSLGIVLHEMLVGRVPFHAEDSLAVGIMHITEPVPVLPVQLEALQPLLEKLLAKNPDDRLQNGNEVAETIEQIEYLIARGELRDLAVPDESYRRQVLGGETRVSVTTPTGANSASPKAARQRAEPTFGSLDDLDARDRPRTRGPVSRSPKPVEPRSAVPPRVAAALAEAESGRRNAVRGLVLVLVAVLLGGLFLFQDKLRALLPNTQLNELLVRAEKALAEDRLSGTQGDSARELFLSALQIEPDHELARNGLAKVGGRLLLKGQDSLRLGDAKAAQAFSIQAREVLNGGAAVDQLDADIALFQSKNTHLADLLQRADAALLAGDLYGTESSAATLFQRVLDADPGNALAQNGIKEIIEALAVQVRGALFEQHAERAEQLIEDMARINKDAPEIPELRGQLSQARGLQTAQLQDDLDRGDRELRDGRLDEARRLFESVQQREPGNTRATQGLAQIAQRLVSLANRELDKSNVSGAEAYLAQAERLAPGKSDVASARRRLRELREKQEIAASQPILTQAQLQQVATLLTQAADAAQAGNLSDPPGDSAYDKYRKILAMDKDNAAAKAGIAGLPARARELFDIELSANRLNTARSHYDTLSGLAQRDAALPSMRERLAEAFLNFAAQKIDQGQREAAIKAIGKARELSPNNPNIAVTEQKLAAAGGAGG